MSSEVIEVGPDTEVVMARNNPETIQQTMLKVMADVGAIGKNQRNDFHNYNFRGIDDVMNAFHAPMVEHGLVVIPKVKKSKYWQIETAKGPQQAVSLLVEFTFTNRGGDWLAMSVQGEGRDSGDKATAKALSAATKQAFLVGFVVPVTGLEEGDLESPEPAIKVVKPIEKIVTADFREDAKPGGIEVTIGDIVDDVTARANFLAETKIAAMEAVGGDKAKAKQLWDSVMADVGLETVSTADQRDVIVAEIGQAVMPFETEEDEA